MLHTRFVIVTLNRKQNDPVGQGGVNAKDFRSFLFDMAPKVPHGALLIMDNARIHHANMLKETWKVLNTQYGFEVLYLPPYSPFLNPIELAFNHVKHALKLVEFTGYADFKDKVQASFNAITPDQAAGFERHCKKYYNQCRLGLPFTGKILSPDVPDE